MSEWKFKRDAIRAFRFVRCGFDAQTGVAQLVYAFDDGPELIETVTVPGAPFVLDGERAAAVERALRLLHLFTGVSYYKAAVPGADPHRQLRRSMPTPRRCWNCSTSTAWASSPIATA